LIASIAELESATQVAVLSTLGSISESHPPTGDVVAADGAELTLPLALVKLERR
jgi:hypothetical protein